MNEILEKRKAERHECAVPIESKKGTAFAAGQTVDISDSGVGLISKKFIPINTTMAIEIAFAPEADPVLALGEVKWVERLSNPARYRIGMVFSQGPTGLRSYVSRFFGHK